MQRIISPITSILVFLALMLAAATAVAQDTDPTLGSGGTGAEAPEGTPQVPGDDCAGGIIVDNGTFVDSRTGSPNVQRFTGLSNVKIVKVCTVLQAANNTTGTNIDYDIVFYAAESPGGEPGAELARISADTIPTLDGYPQFEWFSTLTDYDHGSGELFVGIDHDSEENVYLGFDSSGTTGDSYWHTSGGSVTEELSTYGVRLITEQVGAATRATFEVNKLFTDGNPGEVDVTISCNTGLPLEQTKTISQGNGVEFVVTEFDDGELDCEITEDTPAGYDAEYFDGLSTNDVSCEYVEVESGEEYACRITNTPAPVTVDIDKEWVISNEGSNLNGVDTSYKIDLRCTGPIESVSGGGDFSNYNEDSGHAWWTADSDSDASYSATVTPNDYLSDTCNVTETVYDSAIETSNSCGSGVDFDIEVAGGPYGCTLTNTVFFEGIPALNSYGKLLLALLMLGVGFVAFRRLA